MAPIIEKIPDIPNLNLGEGPHWDDLTQSLYFVDWLGMTINKYVPSTKKYTKCSVGEQVSFVIPVKGTQDQFIIGRGKKISIVTWNGESEELTNAKPITEVEEGIGFLNDAKCDSLGRLWTGTLNYDKETKQFGPASGAILSLEKSNLKKHVDGIGISNGLAWNYELKKFYFVDTQLGSVDQFDFELEKGVLSNRVPVFTPKAHNIDGSPDGITIDTDGNLWVACFRGSRVFKIDPRRSETILDTITLPVKQVTSVAFGGPNLDVLYVTTGNLNNDENDQAGGTFKVTGINAKGLPAGTFVP